MKLHSFLAVVLVSAIPTLVVSAPAPAPKATWVKSGRGHRVAPHNSQQAKRQYFNSTGPICGEEAVSITAPVPNIWEGFTDAEAASVVYWLFEQSDLNLTITENATEWDNSVSVLSQHHYQAIF